MFIYLHADKTHLGCNKSDENRWERVVRKGKRFFKNPEINQLNVNYKMLTELFACV